MSTGTQEVEAVEAANLPAIVRQTAEAKTKQPAEARAESIGKALDAAYQNASKLTLSADEAERLAADFPYEAFTLGAGGNVSLIYIEHAYLRERLNQVLGVGAATPIRRREWTEQFEYWKEIRDHKDGGEWHKAASVYVDLVLIIRGCFVSEAIGEAVYYFSNKDGCYSDALESAKSNAFRRCCKEFGVGLQAWKKGFSEKWKRDNPSGKARPESNGAKTRQEPTKPKTEPPAKTTANFELPADWPDTAIHDIKLWVDGFSSPLQFKKALDAFIAEPSLVGTPADWEPVIRHFAETYKAKYQTVGSAKLTSELKAALDKMEADKAEAAELDRAATEAAAT